MMFEFLKTEYLQSLIFFHIYALESHLSPIDGKPTLKDQPKQSIRFDAFYIFLSKYPLCVTNE